MCLAPGNSRDATFSPFAYSTTMPPDQEQEAVEADWTLYLATRADPRQFSEIFRKYYPLIFGYALRRTADVDAAAEIASATFEKALRAFPRFEWREVRLSAWLYRIATNELAAHYRRRRLRLEIRIVDAKAEEAIASSLEEDRDALEQELQQHEEYLWLRQAIDALSPRYQSAITLRYFERKSLAEIGEILGMPKGTVKSLLSRGTARLRTAWLRSSPLKSTTVNA